MVWAYAEQKVHRYLKYPADWFRWSYAVRYEDEGDVERPKVARDAALLHAAVLELDEDSAVLIMSMARDLVQPSPVRSAPVPYMTDPHFATGRSPGERVVGGGSGPRYVVRLAEEVICMEPILERVGRRKSRVVGHEPVKIAVEYCPLQWDPDPAWVVAAAEIHSRWYTAMHAVMAIVKETPFFDHHITGTGITSDEPAPELPCLVDVWGAEPGGADFRAEVEFHFPAPEAYGITVNDGSYQLLRRHARASTR
jgi:hypothetical protein